MDKWESEMSYWRRKRDTEGGALGNSHYQKIMLALSGWPLEAFSDTVVMDFGCGPRGSLSWLDGIASRRIGVDVLADKYCREFAETRGHKMEYVKCSESSIPLVSGLADVLFTINSLDHVADLPTMCGELRRMVKPGGWLFASLNMREPVTVCEPNSMIEDVMDMLQPGYEKRDVLTMLRPGFTIKTERRSGRGGKGNDYSGLMGGKPIPYDIADRYILWLTMKKNGG